MAIRGRGQWTVDGSAVDLRALSVRLKATGKVGLMKNARKAISAGTAPARSAVRAHLRAEMPKRGGLNEWLASARITTSVLTGPRTAGVVIRDSKTGHDLAAVNRTGKARHPTFGHRGKGAWKLTDTGDAHWWEEIMESFDAPVREALIAAMNDTAREAGFRARG